MSAAGPGPARWTARCARHHDGGVTVPFRFAVIADTHVNPTDDESNSPWEVNGLANRRTREVVSQLAAAEPEFVVHLGDMVHPVPGNPGYRAAADRFLAITDQLDVPLHLVPGNHDAGDKPVRWAPAKPISPASLDTYHRTFGPSHYAFDHRDVHLVVINTMLINSGTPAEQEQREWLTEDLRSHAGARILVLGHYPPYLTDPDEPECYDNIAEPGRGWLLGLFERYGVEAYFCGHVHNFLYHRHGGCDLYVLPSTSFVRHDYSELARVPPGSQYGRDDTGKLGHTVVEVHPDHHQVHVVRSHLGPRDRHSPPGDDATRHRPEAPTPDRVPLRGPVTAPVGIDMREPWAERVGLPYNGMLDEFTRRRVRNDYPLLALWELGVRDLRIPLTDLLDPVLVDRMRQLVAIGHRFHAFGYDLPRGRVQEVLDTVAGQLAGVEVVLPPESLTATGDGALARLRARLPCPLTVSPLSTSAHRGDAATRFAHRVTHGFDPDRELPVVAADGVAFSVGADRAPWEAVHRAADHARSRGRHAHVHVTLAGPDPASAPDEATTTGRAAEALLAGWACAPDVLVFLDTLADVDRGYFPRRGLTDRRHTPTLPGRVFGHLHAALHRYGPRTTAPAPEAQALPVPEGRVCSADDGRLVLVLPSGRVDGARLADAVGAATGSTLDLGTGAVRHRVDLRRAGWGRPTLVLPARLE